MKGKTYGLLLGAAGWAMTLATAAHAQASQDSGASNDVGLQEIVVTAQKRSENLQNVPVSVSAVGAATLGNLQATSMQALQGAIPNVQINEFSNAPNTAVYNIRGIGVADADPYAGNAVSIVVDGVPQYFSMGALLDLFDVDRIEVLRGPQGTLFGANTTGGVVNVVTAQPTGKFGGKAEMTYGNYARFDIKAAVDFPIVDGLLAGKVAFVHSERNGFVKNAFDGTDLGSRDLNAVRAYLKLTPSSNFTATLMGEYSAARNGAPFVVNVSPAGYAIRAPDGTPGQQSNLCAPGGGACQAPDNYVSANNSVPDSSRFDNYRAVLTMELTDTPIGDITSVTGYKSFRLSEYTDQDGTALFLDDTFRATRGHQFSEELRTNFKVGDRLHGTVGAFYLSTHYDHSQDFRTPLFGAGFSQLNLQNQGNYSISAFSQLYYDLTDKLTVQGGVRYTYEKTTMVASQATCLDPTGVNAFGCRVPIDVQAASGSKGWNNIGWKLGADYKLGDRSMIYASWARGFKSGGFVGRIGIAQDIGPYNPEHIDTYEAGLKSEFLDRRLRTNLAVFYSNYRAIQLAQQYFIGTQQGNTILNAAKAIIKGAELEVTALPVEGLTLSGSIAYLDARYDTFNFFDAPTRSSINLAGYRLQNAPDWTGSASATYSFEPAGLGKISATIGYNYVGPKYLTNILDTPITHIQATNIVNGNIDFTPGRPDGPITFSIWARNLLNKHYFQSILDLPGTVALASYANPREFGGSARVKF